MIDKRKVMNEYIRREYKGPYHSVSDDSLQYELLESGREEAIEEAMKMFLSEKVGILSHDEIRNAKYQFICGMTQLTRASIKGGVDSSLAYSLSDTFIQRMDLLTSMEEVKKLYKIAWISFLKEVQTAKVKKIISKLTYQIIQYIYDHLHEVLSLNSIAEYFEYNESYISVLFKKEIGIPIKEYIINKKLETASELLVDKNFSISEIADIFAFSSPSHFIQMFKQKYKMTPKEFRNKNYR